MCGAAVMPQEMKTRDQVTPSENKSGKSSAIHRWPHVAGRSWSAESERRGSESPRIHLSNRKRRPLPLSRVG